MAKPTPTECRARVAEIHAELQALRDAEPDKTLRGCYQDAINRVDALLYRIGDVAPTVVIKPAPEPVKPRRAGSVVIARRPKPRP
jgi:hypothetical protein